MKKFYWSLIVILSSLFSSCDKLIDDVHFNDLIGTWGVQSYIIEGHPSAFPHDMRISFYENYDCVEVANNEAGEGSLSTFSFNDNTNELMYGGRNYHVETLDWNTFRVTFINNAGRRSEMTYRRVPQPNLTPEEANLIGCWEQHTYNYDYYLYFYANGDFIDISESRGGSSSTAKFGHYKLNRNDILTYFGNSVLTLPILDIRGNSLTLLFEGEPPVIYTRSY